jgi:tRNA pseudouridine38-40 synthase
VTVRRCVRIDLGYHGKHFYGSQRQPAGRTVQSELESALAQVSGEHVRLAFAGRTDRGVHAVGQVASGEVAWARDLERLRHALDSLTGDDLVVYRVREVDEAFHARFSARQREYRYRVFVSDLAPVLLRDLVWPIRFEMALDVLNEASAMLIGELDFRSFAGAGTGTAESDVDTRRRLDVANWTLIPDQIERHGRLLEFRIRANAFLPHMVRNIVGALVNVGRGSAAPESIQSLLDLRDRKQAPPPAPPEGLTLWSVDYDEEIHDQKPGRFAGSEQE